MNKNDKEEIVNRYKKRLEEHGANIKGLASGTEERREIRFAALAEVAGGVQGFQNSRILDLGCGLGDFLQYLKRHNVSVTYTGYDISPDLISEAKKLHPEAKFEVRDIQEQGLGGEFDYVICSQTFNNKFKNDSNIGVVKDVLTKTYPHVKKGIAIDFVTNYVDFQEERLFYYSPEEMFSFAKTLSKRVVLKHDYPLFEFALFIYPNFEGWGNAKK